jgi:arginase family enzyme
MHLEILDLDGSVRDHADETAAPRWQSVRVLELRDLAAKLRLWSGRHAIAEARRRLHDRPEYPDPTVTLVGSGDFHHLTPLLLERARESITVIHFDNHPDWVRLAPRWHCGSWVNQALRSERVARIVTIGPCSDDLNWPGLKGGNLSALASGKLRLFPWSHAPSRVLRRIRDGASYRCESRHLVWNNLAEMSPEQAAHTILAQIATAAVWLTIDKDVLPENEAVSNWDQGQMPLRAVLALIEAIGRKHRVAGADICGEYAQPRFDSALKKWEVRRDQPRRAPPDASTLARNAEVNRQLLSAIERAARAC